MIDKRRFILFYKFTTTAFVGLACEMFPFERKIAVCLAFSCSSIFADIYRYKRSEKVYI